MDLSDIVSSTIAIFSLLLSCLVAYLTLFKRSKCNADPKSRIILARIANEPYLVLEYEINNYGAKTGSIDDIILTIVHLESDSHFRFIPKFVREDFNIFQNYEIQHDFRTFSGISLGPKERRDLFIVFETALPEMPTLPVGTAIINTSIALNQQKKWVDSRFSPRIKLTDINIKNWTDSPGISQLVESSDINFIRSKLKK